MSEEGDLHDAARQKLDIAIREYAETVKGDTYVEHWIVVFELSSMNDESQDMISYEEDALNTWVHRRGMLEIARSHAANIQLGQMLSGQ